MNVNKLHNQVLLVHGYLFSQPGRKSLVTDGYDFFTDLSSAPQMLIQMFTPIWYYGITKSSFTFYHSYLKAFLGTNALFGSNQ